MVNVVVGGEPEVVVAAAPLRRHRLISCPAEVPFADVTHLIACAGEAMR